MWKKYIPTRLDFDISVKVSTDYKCKQQIEVKVNKQPKSPLKPGLLNEMDLTKNNEREHILYHYHYPIIPDRELVLWENWIKIRNEEAVHLANRTMRPPADLTMNIVENIREDKERKVTLEHAQLEPKYANVRGTLWERPERLKQWCYCTPVYEVHRTAADIGRPKRIEHVGVPQYIQTTEKGVIGVKERCEFKKLNAEYMQYREKRENILKDKIEKIDPHRPDLAQLVIIGSKPKNAPPPPPVIPDIVITEPPNVILDPLFGVYALRVNNTLFYKDVKGYELKNFEEIKKENWHEDCTAWTYYFNVPHSHISRSKIYLENFGTVALRYCWKRIKKPIPFIPEESTELIFFFNKNEDILSPGQKKELMVTFVSDRPGIFNEFWELSICNVFFFEVLGTKVLFNFHGDATEDVKSEKARFENLIDELDVQTTTRMVINLLDEIVDKATVLEPHICPYKKFLLEEELFVMKNPVCYYHQTEVLHLSELYTEMTNKEWDLSISTWREAMIEKEFDERMRHFEYLKHAHSILVKPWNEKDDLAKEKHRAVKLLLGQLMDKFYDEFEIMAQIYGLREEDMEVKSTISTISKPSKVITSIIIDPAVDFMVKNVCYIHIREHIANTIELCAGIIDSLDLKRWLDFDFCQF